VIPKFFALPPKIIFCDIPQLAFIKPFQPFFSPHTMKLLVNFLGVIPKFNAHLGLGEGIFVIISAIRPEEMA